MKNKMLLTILAITIIGAGLFTTTKALAENPVSGQNPMQSLVQKIADKFGLNKDEVQAVFDQDRADRRAERETQYLARLDQLVTDGKITAEQKQLIIDKHKELETKRQSEMQAMQGKTGEERKALMEAKRTEMETQRKELEAWATQNGIEIKYLMGGFGRHGGRGGSGGFGKPHPDDFNNNSEPTDNSNT